ncbi:hypothetical protein EON79_13380 [bacterium]|nr:MAG: hypothetical protein EON79_13380 [bacterium]
MNEENLQRMIREYGDALPTLPERPRRSSPVRVGMKGALLLAALAGTAIVLMPPSAEARAMGEMRDALAGVRTFHAKIWMRHGPGKPGRLVSEMWMKGGIWCFESRKGTPSHASWILKGDRQYMNDLVRRVSTVEPRVASNTIPKTALDFVIQQTDTGPMGIPRRMTKTDGPVTDGRATYRLEFWKAREESPQENSRTVILVDAEKNLPLWSETTSHDPDSGWSVERSDYEFDRPVEDRVLQPPFKPVIDLEVRQRARLAAWRGKPVAKAGGTTLLDVQMNEEGAVFVLFEGAGGPTDLVASDGTRYLQAMDYRPGGTWGDTGTQKRCEGVRGTVYVPVTLRAPAEPRFRFSLGGRTFQRPGFSHAEPARPGAQTGSTEVRATPCETWPDYQYEMMLGHFFANVAPRMASTEAAYLEKQSDVKGAVARYRIAYERMKGFLPSIAYRELIPAEKLLRSKGEKAEADALARIIARERAVDPNQPEKPTP